MNIKLCILLLAIGIISFNCHLDQFSEAEAEQCVMDNFDTYTIGETACIFYEMYYYKSEYYYVYNCCVCDLIPMAVDCDGNFLCSLGGDCMNDFYDKAELIFTFTSE